MPSKRASSSASTPSKPPPTAAAAPTPQPPAHPPTRPSQSPAAILRNLWSTYVSRSPQPVKLIDVFLGFLVVLAGLQFLYCVVAGNYPFNAFLSGFAATVGQFVLTASLRIQMNPENKSEFSSVSNERAFADYVFGSMLLHFICVNFIN